MIYTFNNIELDSENYRLLVDGVEQSVVPQVFNLIVYLIQNKEKVISRDEILEHVWKDKIVSDSSISNHIKIARRVLGDDGNKQHIIKTIHSRGYQFVSVLQNKNNIVKSTTEAKRPNLYIGIFPFVLLLLFLGVKFFNQYELRQSVKRIASYQEISYVTFIAQAKRRNELVKLIEARIGEKRKMQFEKYFSHYFGILNEQEMFVFKQIRAMTDIGLYQNNLKVVEELNNNPQIFSLIPGTLELQQHLKFWLNKYHGVFKQSKDMCLLYVGVEDGVPYPSDVNKNLKDWLHN